MESAVTWVDRSVRPGAITSYFIPSPRLMIFTCKMGITRPASKGVVRILGNGIIYVYSG